MPTEPRYKNLVLLLADQLRHDAPGYAGGLAPTPSMDRLAAGGAAYTRAYTPMTVCAPARQALLCGQHPDSWGGFWNHGFFPGGAFSPQATFTGLLAENGRRGGFVGKWNVAPGSRPQDFGFDYYLPKSAHAGYLSERYPALEHTGGWMGCESPLPAQDSDTHFLARHAARFIEETGDDFFLWVDFGAPHLPCRPSAPFAGMVGAADVPKWPGYDDGFLNKPTIHRQQVLNWRLEDTPWEEMAAQVARYYGVVAQLDDAMGLVLAALERAGRLEDTLIVLTSDHGDMCGNHRMLDKHYVLYNDVARVPLVLYGAGLEAGQRTEPVSNCLDLGPTICALMGLPPLPGAHGRPLPVAGGAPRDFATSSTNGQQFGFFNARMITDGRWKYVWNLTDLDELYDTAADPGECHNLAFTPACAGELKRLRLALYQELAAHKDMLLSDWTAPQLLESRKAGPQAPG